jgi:PAS domain S-box-containing protein
MNPDPQHDAGGQSKEVYRELSAEVLGILNGPGEVTPILQRVMVALKRRLGIDAVGVRLQEGEDFPYRAQEGFSPGFLLKENSIVSRHAGGGLCRNPDGSVCLECTCGLVISGRTDPSHPLFTRGGSCWTNDAVPLLHLPAGQDPRRHPRNECIHQGYVSVALIPIRDQTTIVGLIQLNDRRAGCFTLEAIEALEGLAAHVGAALMRKQAEQALQRAFDELDQRVAERTQVLQLVNQDLREEIGERERAEAALRAASHYARSLIETSLDPLVTISPEGKITDVNRATEKATGLSRERLIGSDFAECFTAPEQAREGYKKVFVEGRVYDYPLAIRHSSGAVIDVLYNAAIYRNQQGEVAGVFAAARDVTERKRAAAEKEKLESQTRELQKSESLGRMAGAIAHHFNNQLQAVMLRLEVAAQQLPREAPAAESLTEAMRAARKAAEVSTQMLTYLGQSHGKRVPLGLSEVCARGLALLRVALPQGVALESDLPPPGPVVLANANQLQQALTNLVTNACEAGGPSQRPVGVRVRVVPAADLPAARRFPIDFVPRAAAYACIEVSDAGCGISAEELGKVFDPFYSTKFTGRGMGLPAVLGIARAHDGVVTAESAPGMGSTFRVFLPLSTEVVPPPATPRAAVPTAARGVTVLLVEDDPTVRQTVQLALETCGFAVLAAEDGVAAIAQFDRHRQEIGCVLCDLTMPGLNGWATLAELRRRDAGLPVILSSGYSEAEVMQGEHPEQPQAFLHKPYDLKALTATLRRVQLARK